MTTKPSPSLRAQKPMAAIKQCILHFARSRKVTCQMTVRTLARLHHASMLYRVAPLQGLQSWNLHALQISTPVGGLKMMKICKPSCGPNSSRWLRMMLNGASCAALSCRSLLVQGKLPGPHIEVEQTPFTFAACTGSSGVPVGQTCKSVRLPPCQAGTLT